MFKILFIFLLFISFSKAENYQNKEFFNNLINTITTTANSDLPDNIKLQKIQQYVKKLKLQKDKELKNSLYDLEAFNFNLMSHHDNYLLFGGYSPSNLIQKHWKTDGTRDFAKEYKRSPYEAQFQLSLKVPLIVNMFNTSADLYVAYTQNSYWQVYDKSHSRPFRETNYMPELFVEWQPAYDFGWGSLEKTRVSLIHQSNGEDIGYSRSWNRTEALAQFKTDDFRYGFSFWDRWNEDRKKNLADSDGDDNPDLEEYIGKQKFFINYNFNHYGLLLEHQNDIFEYDIHKGNTKFDVILPTLSDNFNFFLRYFYGYGESLIDYNERIRRISFGVKIHEWE
jgi:phospholipase A1/A2